MLFNSLEFFLFLPIVFFLYWKYNNIKTQNILILISSYVFYGWWDWRFLFLIFMSTVVDYFVVLSIENNSDSKKRKRILYISVFFNLALLGVFKYFNFFIDSWVDFISVFGYNIENTWSLKIILPVGISFYTFQTMSYSLDVYRRELKTTKDFISFASFVSFFPQLVAGPIERASHLLPQILNKRKFSYIQSVEGLRLILWGLFKKVVIADSLSLLVNPIFDNYLNLNGGVLLLGLIYFSFQIYCDFSGYSDIAIGTAKLFGIELRSNFIFPYFSRDIGEFWRRWHISLSSWFKDYLYIPLGGSKKGKWMSIRNVFIIFIVSGFWHGANLTFIIWGLAHSMLYLILSLKNQNRKVTTLIVSKDSLFPSLKECYQITITFLSVMITWVFFRSDSVTDAFLYLLRMFTDIAFPNVYRSGFIYVILIVLFDWWNRKDERKPLNINSFYFRWTSYVILIILILGHSGQKNEFIYFQF
ncbi:MAG: MBOAT family protein [Flavobacteriales bacterium]|jgi:alginate O-acetyltransferase complex protein AlgI|nr:MBOAT family protein [Flavobacteriales bacterium]